MNRIHALTFGGLNGVFKRSVFKRGVYISAVAVALALSTPANAGDPIQFNPDTIKKLLNKNKSFVHGLGALKNDWLYKFNVPVNVMDVHPDMTKVGVICMVYTKTGDAKGEFIAVNTASLNNGAYNGSIPVRVWRKENFNSLDSYSGGSASASLGELGKVSMYVCGLFFLRNDGQFFPARDENCKMLTEDMIPSQVCARPDPKPKVRVQVTLASGQNVPPPPSQNN